MAHSQQDGAQAKAKGQVLRLEEQSSAATDHAALLGRLVSLEADFHNAPFHELQWRLSELEDRLSRISVEKSNQRDSFALAARGVALGEEELNNRLLTVESRIHSLEVKGTPSTESVSHRLENCQKCVSELERRFLVITREMESQSKDSSARFAEVEKHLSKLEDQFNSMQMSSTCNDIPDAQSDVQLKIETEQPVLQDMQKPADAIEHESEAGNLVSKSNEATSEANISGVDQGPGLGTAQPDNGLPVRQFSEKMLQMESISINPSSWEVIAFVGSDGFGKLGSMVMMTVVVLNICVQTLFCFIGFLSLTEDDFNEEARSEYEEWRISAHELSKVDRVRGETLVQRVCDLDGSLSIGTKQLLVREVIQRYTTSSILTGGVPAGELMCMLALLVWYLTVGAELNAMYDYVSVLTHVPTGQFQIVDVEDTMSDAIFKLESLDIIRKAACYFVTLTRFVIAGFLAFVGTLAIVNTNSVGDLLLNALALEMILNVDEYLFACMVPAGAQRFVNMMAPVRLKLRQWHSISFQIFSGFVLVPLALVLVYFTMVAPHVQDLLAVERSLCSGNNKFAYIVDATGFPHATDDFKSYFEGVAANDMNQITLDAVKSAALIEVSPDSPENLLRWQRSISKLDEIQGMREAFALQALAQPRCKDLLEVHECSVPVLQVSGKCPTGYMDPRDPAECRSAAIAIGFWNESMQEQQSRAKVEADIEQAPPESEKFRPCVLLAKEQRTLWLDGASLQMGLLPREFQGPCICEPQTAASYQRYATVLNKVPVRDCEQLLRMGACTMENPQHSGSFVNASVTRWLCPEICGCNLIPRSPLRTIMCPTSCWDGEPSAKDRECRDLSADEFRQTPQVEFLLADLQSMKSFSSGIQYPNELFLEELEFCGCNLVQVLRNPYGNHSVDVAPPCQRNNPMEQLSCLALRCQDVDPKYCTIHIRKDRIDPISRLPEGCERPTRTAELWPGTDSYKDEDILMSMACPRTCGTCLEVNLCNQLLLGRPGTVVHPFAGLREAFTDVNEGQFVRALATLFTGYCPKACECKEEIRSMRPTLNKDDCPKECWYR